MLSEFIHVFIIDYPASVIVQVYYYMFTFLIVAQVVDQKFGRPLHAAFFTGQVGFHDLLFVSAPRNIMENT